MSESIRPAWIDITTEEDLRAFLPPGGNAGYDFGFLPAMGRLLASHPRIGLSFVTMFVEIMFNPDGVLDRRDAACRQLHADHLLPPVLVIRHGTSTESSRAWSA